MTTIVMTSEADKVLTAGTDGAGGSGPYGRVDQAWMVAQGVWRGQIENEARGEGHGMLDLRLFVRLAIGRTRIPPIFA